ncbi:hypothetical protein QN277_011672 [Acacia crassicarpa]|uniref:Methionyl-tRNA formyltransferase n=1 Tax=Acacia crassicarpa TaxID=499986 RepID=A0AAE1MZI9_9FABA|nr:hypothetical protein QN277_011672 [Acacia crassicarpa]
MQDNFLSNLRCLQPDLCITAAYENILPSKFLNIPPLGTVNIHPSLLPLYCGAAPIQRELQDGVKETGVSLVFTVRELDAGQIIANERFEVDDQIKINPEESWLSFDQEALVLHNKVCAFAGWPGIRAKVLGEKNGEQKTMELKIITTRVGIHKTVLPKEVDDITFVKDALVFPCAGGTALEVCS